MGYRWVNRGKTKPQFAFGHGFHYTTFKLSDARANAASMTRDGRITFTVNVKNTGKRAGAEVVSSIHDVKASLDRPEKELKGFKKVWLSPGESKDVDITIDNSALSFYDEATQSWVSESGDFIALIGNAADNLAKLIFVNNHFSIKGSSCSDVTSLQLFLSACISYFARKYHFLKPTIILT